MTALLLVIRASNDCNTQIVAVFGVGTPATKSGQAILTVPDTAGVDLADVPPAFEASIV